MYIKSVGPKSIYWLDPLFRFAKHRINHEDENVKKCVSRLVWATYYWRRVMNTLLYIWYSFFRVPRSMVTPQVQKLSTHMKARCDVYPGSDVRRQAVPNGKVSWTEAYPNYNPPEYTAPVVKKNPVWADSEDTVGSGITFNKHDGLINRISFTGDYKLVDDLPQNPIGRTGLKGRGLLGKWGPNHAADPIVTRWLYEDGKIVKDMSSNKPVLQFVAIMRADSYEWAIPGGMVDAGERVSLTLKREFGEEALNSLKYSDDERQDLEKQISTLFATGEEIYKGYVDDPRNTDNAWMETVAVNFHDEEGTSVSKLPLEAGDDAGSVRWMTVSSALKLYASHSDLLRKTAERRNAHW